MRQLGLGKAQLASSLGHAVRDPGKEPAVLCMGEPLADPLELVLLPGSFLTHISRMLYIARMRYERSIVGSWSGGAVLAVVIVLVAVTIYETAVALGAIGLGSLPGEGAPGSDIAGVAAAVGVLAAALLAAALAGVRRAPSPAALLGPSAAAFLVAHFYTFDPYYLPSMIRVSERDFMPPAIVFSVAGLAIAAGFLARNRPSLGLALSAPLILACGLTAFFAGVGH